MKYLLIQILTCLPLAGLTGWSVAERFRDDNRAATSTEKLNLEDAKLECAEIAVTAKQDLPVATEFATIDPLSGTPQTWPTASSPKLQQAALLAKQAAEVRGLAAKVIALPAPKLPADPATALQATIDQLADWTKLVDDQRDKFIGKNTGKVPGAEALFQSLDRQIVLLKNRKDELDVEGRVNDALRKAADKLGRRTAAMDVQCLADLDQEPLFSARDPQQRARIEQVRLQARYRLDWRKLFEGPARRGNPRAAADDVILEQIASLDKFLVAHPEPPTTSEAKAHAQAKDRLAALQLEISVRKLVLAADLDDLLKQTEAILASPAIDRAGKDRIHSQIKQWLLKNQRFPERIAPDCLLGKQEAVTKTGQRLVGVFYLPPGVDQWRFWHDAKVRREQPRGELQVGRDGFESSPDKPKYVQWAGEYNELREKLVRQNGSKDDWIYFVRRCQQIQKELTVYREKWGFTEEADNLCRDWTFEPQVSIAQQLIDRWDRYQAILQKSP